TSAPGCFSSGGRNNSTEASSIVPRIASGTSVISAIYTGLIGPVEGRSACGRLVGRDGVRLTCSIGFTRGSVFVRLLVRGVTTRGSLLRFGVLFCMNKALPPVAVGAIIACRLERVNGQNANKDFTFI